MNLPEFSESRCAPWIGIIVALQMAGSLSAEQFDLFTYQLENREITIIDYPEDAAGPVTIPSAIEGLPVTQIGEGAFARCVGLTSVSIPSSVHSIGESAFANCSGLTEIDIPESVKSIGDQVWSGRVFAECTSLTSIKIPSSIATIGRSSFIGCTSLTDVTISEGVTFIGEFAFARCTGLTNITIPKSITRVGNGAFALCTNLTKVAIPESVTFIGREAFKDCSDLALATLQEGVKYISDSAFENCTSLTAITIPSSVTAIGMGYADDTDSFGSAFAGCSSLKAIVVAEENPTYASEEGVLFNVDRSTLIHYPEGKAGSYTIPHSVAEIAGWVADFSGQEFWESGAFSNCDKLTSITISPSVTSVGSLAFSGCTNLTNVVVPDSVNRIDSQAFASCSGLTHIVFLGDAPSAFGEFLDVSGFSVEPSPQSVFAGVAPGFTLYYLSKTAGFSSPTWNGYPAVRIDEEAYPAARWLLEHNLPHDLDLKQHQRFLTAYALHQPPSNGHSLGLRAPVYNADTGSLSLSFHATSQGIVYRVETSTDLQHWTKEGVTLSELGEDQMRTASVEHDGASRFMRLVVEATF